MKSLLRSIVASPKNNHYDSTLGIQLDLSYITPQLIVCSGPTNNYWKSFYRYPIQDLVHFLDFNHENHWYIWNYRSEDQGGYQDSDVYNRVCHLGFPDHQVPTLDIMIRSCESIDKYLSESRENVAILHCKAGKGRSGTLCCAYIMYESMLNGDVANVSDVIDHYTKIRMKEFAGDGISIQSQRRYLEYWHQYLKLNELDRLNYIETSLKGKFVGIKVVGLQSSLKSVFDLYLGIEKYNKDLTLINKVFDFNMENCKVNVDEEENSYYITSNTPIPIISVDIRLTFQSWCYAWFNILFEPNHTISLKWEQFDGFKGTKQKGFKLFEKLEIHWEE
ncbi:protein tyrosine phosphatase [Scheffersomyces coipomensis]|uniref:protein tyrosine phosphatase n=1 Tax=Scheffersomyces coipomensis TaxID=1788519 RepID=UPI00315CF6F9